MPQPLSRIENLHDITAEILLPRTRSVLILEDDLSFAQVIGLFLSNHSFEVCCVPNGVEGLECVMDRDFDVILCDLGMPNLPGDMFHLAVQRARAHLTERFIFMTGQISDPRWAGFLSKTTNPVIEKPFSLEGLLSTIQTLLTTIELKGE
jgi:two-component system, OmpR family, response regulator QseB